MRVVQLAPIFAVFLVLSLLRKPRGRSIGIVLHKIFDDRLRKVQEGLLVDRNWHGDTILRIRVLLSDIFVKLGLVTVTVHLALLRARVTSWLAHEDGFDLGFFINFAAWLDDSDQP